MAKRLGGRQVLRQRLRLATVGAPHSWAAVGRHGHGGCTAAAAWHAAATSGAISPETLRSRQAQLPRLAWPQASPASGRSPRHSAQRAQRAACRRRKQRTGRLSVQIPPIWEHAFCATRRSSSPRQATHQPCLLVKRGAGVGGRVQGAPEGKQHLPLHGVWECCPAIAARQHRSWEVSVLVRLQGPGCRAAAACICRRIAGGGL